MKIVSLMTMLVALLVAPIACAYSYRYTDNSVDPDLAPRVHNVTNEEREEQELRRLLIERLRQENQMYALDEMNYADDIVSGSVANSKFDETRKILKSNFKGISKLAWFVLGGLVLIGWISDKYWLSHGAVVGFALDKFVLPIINQLFL